MARFYRTKHCAGIMCFSILTIYLLSRSINLKYEIRILERNDGNFTIRNENSEKRAHNTIRIASTICSNPYNVKYLREEMAVLIKSVVISTILYKISDAIEFYLVVSSKDDEQYFKALIEQYNHSTSQAQLNIYIYSADDAIKNNYPLGMRAEERHKCQYLRIFLPTILTETDAVIYFDTDIIVTGNLKSLWDKFYEMEREQIVAMSPDTTANNPEKITWYGDLPYAPPKALNAGVQLMNLTRMRKFGWSEKYLQVYHDYVIKTNFKMRSNQKLINILLYFNPALFLELPCHFNFWSRHCLKGFYCDAAFTDPSGIQILHGATNTFGERGMFIEIFKGYREFNLTSSSSKSDLINLLINPMRSKYTNASIDKSSNNTYQYCQEVLAKHVFKNFINNAVE